MKAIIIVIFALLTCAHGQQRAFWKFYSEADCQDDKIIGYAMEPVVSSRLLGAKGLLSSLLLRV